jgi:hypothetical protein
MFSVVVVFAAFFSFGYCVADMVLNWRSANRLNEMLRETIENEKRD